MTPEIGRIYRHRDTEVLVLQLHVGGDGTHLVRARHGGHFYVAAHELVGPLSPLPLVPVTAKDGAPAPAPKPRARRSEPVGIAQDYRPALKARGIKVAEIAKALNLSPNHVAVVVAGKRRAPVVEAHVVALLA